MKEYWGFGKLASLKQERRRAEILHGILQALNAAGHLQNRAKAFRLCRADLKAKGLEISLPYFVSIAGKWLAAPSPETLIRKNPTAVGWGILTPAQLRREKRRAEILHGILLELETAGFLKNIPAAFRLCRAQLVAKKLTMSCVSFSRQVHKWKVDPSPESLIRKRKAQKPFVPFSAIACQRVVEFAVEKKIGLSKAVEELKAAGSRRVPSRGTILAKLPWSDAVDAFAFQYSRIQQGLAAMPSQAGGVEG